MKWTTKVMALFAVMLVFSAFTALAQPQGRGAVYQLSQSASADPLSDGVNNSMQSYVPIMLTIIFVVLIVGFILTLKKK